MLKIHVCSCLNRVQSSRSSEAEGQRNLELIWLTGRLAPDFKTIADFRLDNGEAIRKPGREDCHLQVHRRGSRQDPAQVLIVRLSEVPNEATVHDGQVPSHRPLGARRHAGGRSGSA